MVAVDPMSCDFVEKVDGVHIRCSLKNVWTMCRTSICGQAPACSFEPVDNSEDACRRRLEWMEGRR